MVSPRFRRFVLRTTAVQAATAFYDAVLGGHDDGVFELPSAAISRGARPHWLGLIGVEDLGSADDVAARFVEAGAMRLGPAGVGDIAVVRDPGGAVVGMTGTTAATRAAVVWHQLLTQDAERAAQTYGELFGWVTRDEADHGELGKHRKLAWSASEPVVGAIADVVGRPGVHAHWLFFFAVASLEAPMAATLTRGGKVFGPFTLPGGARVAVCDDPQGAAFGLMEAGTTPSSHVS